MPAVSSTAPGGTVATTQKKSLKRKLNQDQGNSPTPPGIHVDSTTIANPPSLLATAMRSSDGQEVFYSTRSHPINKSGFRYLPCGPCASFTPLYPVYNVIHSPPGDGVRFSWEDRSPYVYLTSDATAVTTDKGFRAARANCPLRSGKWYY